MRHLFLPRCFAVLSASYRSHHAFTRTNLYMLNAQILRRVHLMMSPIQAILANLHIVLNLSGQTSYLFYLLILENAPAIYWIFPWPRSCLRNNLLCGSIMKIVAGFLKPMIWEIMQKYSSSPTLFSPLLSILLYHLCDLDPQPFGYATQICHLVHFYFWPHVHSSELVKQLSIKPTFQSLNI